MQLHLSAGISGCRGTQANGRMDACARQAKHAMKLLPLPARSWLAPHGAGRGAGVALVAARRRWAPPGPPARAAAARRAGPAEGAGALHDIDKGFQVGFAAKGVDLASQLGRSRGADRTIKGTGTLNCLPARHWTPAGSWQSIGPSLPVQRAFPRKACSHPCMRQ